MKRLIKTGLVALTLAASACVPYKLCNKGTNGVKNRYQCKITKDITGDFSKDEIKFTLDRGNCIIDVTNKKRYDIYIDRACDGTVDTYFGNDGRQSREEFGDKYDARFKKLRAEVGSYEKTIKIKF